MATLRKHSMTGPIWVNGAEPGDVMEIRIVPKAFAINFNLPGKEFPTIGALASEMPDGFVKFFYLDWEKKQAEFKPGIVIDLQPFPGTLAVGIDPNDPSPRKGGVKDDLRPGLPQGRPHLGRRLALPAGQRRGEPHRARVRVPGDRPA